MTILRRVLLLWLFMVWQGGFVFYGAVVVPISTSVLGLPIDQGFITRHVAVALNLSGFAVLLAWLWDLCAERASMLWLRWATWAFMFMTLIVLSAMQVKMDAHMDAENHRVRERAIFRSLHRWYLDISAAQWVAAIAFTVGTVHNWRAGDRRGGEREAKRAPNGA